MSTSVDSRLNSRARGREHIASHQVKWTWPVIMLFSRLALFAFWQAILALIFAVLGWASPWNASIAWWPVSAILSNLVSLLLLIGLARQEGMSYFDYLNFERRTLWRDLLISLGILVISAPLAYIPNVALAQALFGDPQQTFELMFHSLPLWAAYLSLVLFPISIALAELPTYFGYTMPRLAVLTGRGWAAVSLAALFLSLQHTTLPLIFDWRFILWRAVMFLPFALLVAIALYWRPRLLAFLMIGHGLIDLQVGLIILTESSR